MRIVTADSNIYVSALVFGGKPLQLSGKCDRGRGRLIISEDILDETVGVLKKFNFPDERIARAKEYIKGCTEQVEVKRRLRVVAEDPDDDRILECAVASGSDTIVTGDKDLLRRGDYEGIRIADRGSFGGRLKARPPFHANAGCFQFPAQAPCWPLLRIGISRRFIF